MASALTLSATVLTTAERASTCTQEMFLSEILKANKFLDAKENESMTPNLLV